MEKNYKYQFSKVFYIVAIVGSLLALGCIAINVIRLIGFLSKNVAPGFYEWVSIIISVLLSIAFIVFIVAAIINSTYQITDKSVVLKWGVIKNVIDLSEVKQIKFTTNKNKLELVFEDESYFIIVVANDQKQAFIDEITKKFPNISYLQETEEEKK